VRAAAGASAGAAAEEVAAAAAAPVGNRGVRTRAAVAKEAAVVPTRVAGRGKGSGAGTGRKATRNAKPIVQQQQQPKAAAVAAPAAPKAKAAAVVRGKQVPSRSHSSDPEPLQDPCTSEDNVEEDLDLGEEKPQEEGAEEIREMEEESAGRSAEKLPGVGDDDGSAAPLPERVIGDFLFGRRF